MVLIPIEEKEKGFMLLQARESFKQTIRTCAYAVRNDIQEDNELFYPLIVAAHVLYSRPFQINYGFGKLYDILIPEEYIAVHDEILNFRNKVFAHRQLKEKKKGENKRILLDLHSVYFQIRGNQCYSIVAEKHPDVKMFSKIHDLSYVLLMKVRYHSEKLFKKYQKAFPELDGSYIFEMDDGAGSDFKRVEDIELSENSFSANLPSVRKKI
jgi:hypothetical protein